MTALYVLGGAAILLVAGDMLVRGAIALSLRLGLSAVLVSLTVVALGTSAPELIISVLAALEGSPDIAVGNVVGSNIANILLVVGVPAALVSIAPCNMEIRKNYVMMLAVTAGFTALAFVGNVGRLAGLAMVAALVAVIVYSYRQATRNIPDVSDEIDVSAAEMPGWNMTAFLLAGIVGLPIGAQFLIEGARDVGLSFGLSEAAIGLTIVALGTSLPELAASTAAALRGRGEVAIANVIGSNIFNILAVIGITAIVHPLKISPSIQTVDLPIMVVSSLLLARFLIWHRSIGRIAGVVFILCYAAFAVLALGDVTL